MGRIGLGCMRLSSEEAIAAAVDAGVTVFDTARAYGGNERLVANALRGHDAVRVVTKGGMAPGWIPDGRAKAIRADCEASLSALDGVPIDTYLLHVPDPRTPWATSVRALARLHDEGLVRRIGISNVNRGQLDEALELAPIAAVEVALSLQDDRALRGGIVDRCAELGITLLAHSPLGGPKRVGALARLAPVAERRGATVAEVALAWLLNLSPVVVPIPGATRPETVRSAVRAQTLALDDADREELGRAFARARAVARAKLAEDAEVVVVMGIPGAGKSRIAEAYGARGYVRLNRDKRGGSLTALAAELDERLAGGTPRLVLDNTYLTRATRNYVLEVAKRHDVAARCIWLETPLAQAQINLVQRLLDRFGTLPSPEQVKAIREPGLLAPTSQMRALRELEPPSTDEGFTAVERVPFVRAPATGRAGVFVAASALERRAWLEQVDRDAPFLLFDWRPDGSDPHPSRGGLDVAGPVERAACPHPAGPPVCWCRPPLPGLPLAFARTHGVDPSRSTLVGTSSAHRALATALGARYVES